MFSLSSSLLCIYFEDCLATIYPFFRNIRLSFNFSVRIASLVFHYLLYNLNTIFLCDFFLLHALLLLIQRVRHILIHNQFINCSEKARKETQKYNWPLSIQRVRQSFDVHLTRLNILRTVMSN